MTTPRIVLASASPRRRELLTLIGVPHEVLPANVDEAYIDGEDPRAHAERLARQKAEAIATLGSVTIGSDTVVVVDGDVLGKPENEIDAARMLRRLSGRSHIVLTGVAVDFEGRMVSEVEEVVVTFRHLTDEDIREYVATGEPMDKAGAYGIQGYGATIVDRVNGDYFAVMGLALNCLVRLMNKVGVEYRFGHIRVAPSTPGRHTSAASDPPSP